MILDNFAQWLVANTLYQETIQLLNLKDGFKENMRIGPVLEVTTSFQHFKYGIEIRIESVNKDGSHSLVRISYGTVKYVIVSIEEENSEIPADPHEDQTPQTSIKCFCSQIKGKSKTSTERNLLGRHATIPIHQRRWCDI